MNPQIHSCCSVAKLYLTICDSMDYSMPGFPVFHYILEFVQTHVNWVDDAMEPFHPLLSPSPFALNLLQHQGLFQSVSSLHQVAKLLELQHQAFQWYSGLISLRFGWFDLLAVQGNFKSLLQHQNLKTSVLWCLAFFMVPLSHLHVTTGKTIALTTPTFAAKWCLCFLICPLGLSLQEN